MKLNTIPAPASKKFVLPPGARGCFFPVRVAFPPAPLDLCVAARWVVPRRAEPASAPPLWAAAPAPRETFLVATASCFTTPGVRPVLAWRRRASFGIERMCGRTIRLAASR